MHASERERARAVDERDGAQAPRRVDTVPEQVLALQRVAGNAAVGGLLARSRVLARAPSVESMDSAFAEFGVRVAGANVFSFIVQLRRAGSLDDGGRGFSWADFLRVIPSAQGKKWVKDKWRDKEGAEWGDQVIQGQHEWIKTDDVNYVIKTVVVDHGGANLDAWLAACESLRIPTADVAFNPQIEAEDIDEANEDPTAFTANSLGQFSGHVGAYYEEREIPHANPKFENRPLTTGEKKNFHTPLHKLLLTHLNARTNDLSGFLTGLREFQSQALWGGGIEGLEAEKAQQIPNDFRAKQQGTRRRGRYTSSYQEGVGISTAFQEAGTVADLQTFAAEAKTRNEQMMDRRINAIISMTRPPNIPQPLSNFRHTTPSEPAWIVDPAGKSVADYDRDAGYDASGREPITTADDIEIPDDIEPDEDYTAAKVPTPAPVTMPNAPLQVPEPVLRQYGVARSKLTHDLEQRFATVNAEVLAVTGQAFAATTKALDEKVSQALATADPMQAPAIRAAANAEREKLRAHFKDRIQAPYQVYVARKRELDLHLFAQEPRQTTALALQQLLEGYLKEVNQLLDAYIAAMRQILSS